MKSYLISEIIDLIVEALKVINQQYILQKHMLFILILY